MTDWDDTLADLATRRAAAQAMGGEERVARHRQAGKLDARARVTTLLDPGSFAEIGTLVGEVPADAFIAGTGTIDARQWRSVRRTSPPSLARSPAGTTPSATASRNWP